MHSDAIAVATGLPIQEYTDTHVYTTIYDQGSFKPVARLAWLRDDIPQVANDEPIIKQDNLHIKTEVEPKSKIEVYHYHNDQLGTPNELTNEKGEVIWLTDYEAWGNTAKVIYSESKLEELKVAKEHLQPIRFQGQYFDIEAGLHYNRFRYYDPDIGMFTTRDSIGLRGGDNVFQYAPNPTGWIDPLGLDSGINMRNFEGIMGGYTANDMVPSKVKPLTKNQTVTTDVGLSLKAWLGGGLTFSGGKSYDKNGEVLSCYIVTPCMSAAPGAKAALSLTKTKTNASTKKGIGSVSQICGGGSVAAVVGATGGVCQNSDKSISGTGGLLLGGSLDLDVSACQPISYCH